MNSASSECIESTEDCQVEPWLFVKALKDIWALKTTDVVHLFAWKCECMSQRGVICVLATSDSSLKSGIMLVGNGGSVATRNSPRAAGTDAAAASKNGERRMVYCGGSWLLQRANAKERPRTADMELPDVGFLK